MSFRRGQLEYFVAVAEDGQMTSAARRLGIAQPALSQAIAQLETDLGLKLLDRHPRGVTLTDAGEALYAKACVAVAASVAADGTARSLARGHQGVAGLRFPRRSSDARRTARNGRVRDRLSGDRRPLPRADLPGQRHRGVARRRRRRGVPSPARPRRGLVAPAPLRTSCRADAGGPPARAQPRAQCRRRDRRDVHRLRCRRRPRLVGFLEPRRPPWRAARESSPRIAHATRRRCSRRSARERR